MTQADRGLMRVVHIIKVTRVSGAEGHLLVLLAGLRNRGIDARLIILVEPDKPMEDMVATAADRGIPTSSLIIRRDYDLPLLFKLRNALREMQPDIVHTHLIHADVFGYFAAKAVGTRIIISSRHNDDQFRYRPRWRRINRWLWRRIDAGIAISYAIKQFTVDIEGAPTDKVKIVHYGMDYSWMSDAEIDAARLKLRAELNLDDDALLLGLVCRLVEQKGIPYAMEALRRLRAEFPGAHLVIAGDGEKAAELRRLASALGIADRVHWLGWRPKAIDLMAAFDVLLVPSLWEGFGLVLLEAMSRRVPVIASRVSAIPEVVRDGETGILFEPRNVDALTGAIVRLLSDRSLRKYMGLLGAARLEEHFSVQRMVDKTIAVYDQVLR
ncbi:MAG: glycosyltransferase family 4 protein [Chloroflexi bacterium]|nr:glycosyltransferase family 4 protein [Chloroflexota bacterium]